MNKIQNFLTDFLNLYIYLLTINKNFQAHNATIVNDQLKALRTAYLFMDMHRLIIEYAYLFVNWKNKNL